MNSVDEFVNGPSSSAPAFLVPSLRGKLEVDGVQVICKGAWALSDTMHEQPDATDIFEFRLSKRASDESRDFPVNGTYQGWFILKQNSPGKNIKVDEKDLFLQFTSLSTGGFAIEGSGNNKFGCFTLDGHLDENGLIQINKTYEKKQVKSGVGRKRTSHLIEHLGEVNNKKVAIEKNSIGEGCLRGSGLRVRKNSSFVKDAGPTPNQKTGIVKASLVKKHAFDRLARLDSGGGRSPRLSPALQRCGELLKEMFKYPEVCWFSEPLDYVSLNLPHYPEIVSNPIDFQTIREKLESFLYETPERFANDIRLVFTNAVAFNQRRDDPVNIAARRLSSIFEEKFRLLMSNLRSQDIMVSLPESKAGRPSGNKHGLGACLHGAKASSNTKVKGSNGRLTPPTGAYAGALVSPRGASVNMQDLLQDMQKVQDEQYALPLTFEEKAFLVASIEALPYEKMDKVVSVIQAVIPRTALNKLGEDSDAEHIEVPLNLLDTCTLRRLLDYVKC